MIPGGKRLISATNPDPKDAAELLRYLFSKYTLMTVEKQNSDNLKFDDEDE